MWLQIIFLAFAVSIDGFGVGLTFGMRKMKIPLKSIAVISFCSALSLGIAMVIGQFISQLISIGGGWKNLGASSSSFLVPGWYINTLGLTKI